MNNNFSCKITLASIASGILAVGAIPAASRPNLVFLLADDMASASAGWMGNEQAKTPQLDKLASEGLVLRNHHNTTSICMASRVCIMTGNYEFVHGVNFGRGKLKKEQWALTYPMLLKQAGYRVGFAGKFGYSISGLNNPDDFGKLKDYPVNEFDWWAGWPSQGTYKTAGNEYLKQYAEKYPHSTRALGAAGADFISESVAAGKPFCLSISFKAPHSPMSSDPFFEQVYEGVVFNKPVNYGKEGSQHLAPQSGLGRQRSMFKSSYESDKDFQKTMGIYFRQVYGVDYAVGMIRDCLEKNGVADETILIFTSDNGYFLGSHEFGGKVLPYEEATKVPGIIYDPTRKHSHGKQTNGLTSGIDMAPTLLAYAGVEIPAGMDGKSLISVVEDENHRVREELYLTQVWNQNRDDIIGALTVLTEKYRYNYWYYANEKMPPSEELFDRKNDSHEMTNLASSPEATPALEEMRARYDAKLELWKKRRNPDYGYDRYDVLADRNVPWQDKEFIAKFMDYDSKKNVKGEKKVKKVK